MLAGVGRRLALAACRPGVRPPARRLDAVTPARPSGSTAAGSGTTTAPNCSHARPPSPAPAPAGTAKLIRHMPGAARRQAGWLGHRREPVPPAGRLDHECRLRAPGRAPAPPAPGHPDGQVLAHLRRSIRRPRCPSGGGTPVGSFIGSTVVPSRGRTGSLTRTLRRLISGRPRIVPRAARPASALASASSLSLRAEVAVSRVDLLTRDRELGSDPVELGSQPGRLADRGVAGDAGCGELRRASATASAVRSSAAASAAVICSAEARRTALLLFALLPALGFDRCAQPFELAAQLAEGRLELRVRAPVRRAPTVRRQRGSDLDGSAVRCSSSASTAATVSLSSSSARGGSVGSAGGAAASATGGAVAGRARGAGPPGAEPDRGAATKRSSSGLASRPPRAGRHRDHGAAEPQRRLALLARLGPGRDGEARAPRPGAGSRSDCSSRLTGKRCRRPSTFMTSSSSSSATSVRSSSQRPLSRSRSSPASARELCTRSSSSGRGLLDA